MQGPSGEDEQSPYEYSGEAATGILISVIACGGVWFITRRLMASEEDEIVLHVLHFTVKALQTGARLLGQWALQVEKQYNDLVNSLH